MSITLLLFAVVAGVFTMGVLFAQRAHRQANGWLALVVLIFLGSLTHNLFLETGVYERNQWLYFIPINGQLLIGPMLWFYVLRMLDLPLPDKHLRVAHLTPGFIQLTVHACAFFLNDDAKYHFWSETYEPWLKPLFFWAGQLGLVIYLFLMHRTLEGWRGITEAQFSDTRPVAMRWLHRLVLLFALFAAVAFTLGLIPDAFHRTGTVLPTDLMKLFIVCSIGWQGYRQVEVIRLGSNRHGQRAQANESGSNAVVDDAARMKETAVEVLDLPQAPAVAKFDPALLGRITSVLEEQGLYRQPDLTLVDLAQAVQLPAKVVSATINSGTGRTFLNWVNGYRVEAVKAAIIQGEQRSKSLLGLALDAGFNAKSTFNRAFREHEGCSPSDWMARHAGNG